MVTLSSAFRVKVRVTHIDAAQPFPTSSLPAQDFRVEVQMTCLDGPCTGHVFASDAVYLRDLFQQTPDTCVESPMLACFEKIVEQAVEAVKDGYLTAVQQGVMR